MPPIQLTANQVSDIFVFLKSRVAAADIRSATRLVQGAEDKLLTGKPELGKAFFEGTGGCSKCHSPTGDLAGIAKKYSPSELQGRFLYPPRKRSSATITDAAGTKYTGDVMSLTQYDIAIQDAGGWYHSWPLSAVKMELKDPLAAHRELLPRYTDADMHNMLAYLETLR